MAEKNPAKPGGGSSGSSDLESEFGEATSRFPNTVQNVTVVKNVFYGDFKNENVMYKLEGEGGHIQISTENQRNIQTENKPKEKINEEKFNNKAEACIDKVHDKILSTKDIEMELGGLKKPNEVIPPEMTETTKESAALCSAMDEKYDPNKKTFHRTRAHEEYEKPISCEEIVQGNKGCVLTGPAGSGKSTTLKKIVKDVIRNESKNPMKRKNRKLVLYIELKLLQYENDLKPSEALLNAASCGTVEREDRNILVQWMDRNPKRVLVALDGYDQIPKNITEDDELPLHGYHNSTINQYLFGLLVGKVLPGALVVLSTREYALQNIPFDCIPQRVIKLVGLSHLNIDKLVVQLSNQNVLKAIKESDRVVYFLCASPIFLTLVTWVHSYIKPNPPETKSGILMCVIINFLQFENHIRGHTLQNIYNLAKLAFYGVENSKIVFTQDEISRFGLEQKDLKDMIIGVPRERTYTGNVKKLMAGNYQQYFLHQMLQEILASLKIILMEIDQFDGYLGRLADDNYQEVAQLTYGLLFRIENQKMLTELFDAVKEKNKRHMYKQKDDKHDQDKFEKLKDLSKHRTIALKHLKAQLRNGKVGDLQTLRLLYESGDAAIIQNNVKEIELHSLNEFDCVCLGKVLEKSKELSELSLRDTNDDLIGILIQSCEKIPKIDSLWIVGDWLSTTTIGKYYGKLSNHANKLELWGCEFTKQEFDLFVDEIEAKFTEVRLGHTRVELENLDGLIRLMSHIDGTLYLEDVNDVGTTFISSEVKEKIPRQYQGCTVKYESELNESDFEQSASDSDSDRR